MRLTSLLTLVSGFLVAQALPFQVQSFTLQDLLNPDAEVGSKLLKAITEVGIIAVSKPSPAGNIGVLKHLVRCVHSGAAGSHTNDVIMKDQTVRTTLAIATNQSLLMPFADDLRQQCPDFVDASSTLRRDADTVGKAYAHFLDQMEQSAPLLHDFAGPFQSALAKAESLEHFHVFRRRGLRKDEVPTLKMHTDLGMFIVMTPPEYYSLADPDAPIPAVESGFHLQLPNGDVVTPQFPEGSLLVMNGEGSAQWVHSSVSKKLYVPPHEVVLPDFLNEGRAWYGRMYLPPKDAKKENGVVTFGQYWKDGATAVIRAPDSSILMEDTHRLLLVDQGNCSVGSLFCWMTCMPITNVSNCSISDILCSDPSGKLWPSQFPQGNMAMCPTCTLRCNSTRSNAALNTAPAPVLLAFVLACILKIVAA